MEPTLDAALARIFGGEGGGGTGVRPVTPSSTAAPPTTSPAPQGPAGPPVRGDSDMAARARQHYDRAMQAQRDGNWALYGEEIKLLGETLRGMAK